MLSVFVVIFSVAKQLSITVNPLLSDLMREKSGSEERINRARRVRDIAYSLAYGFEFRKPEPRNVTAQNKMRMVKLGGGGQNNKISAKTHSKTCISVGSFHHLTKFDQCCAGLICKPSSVGFITGPIKIQNNTLSKRYI
jgi:hypothetical protein